MNTIFDTAKRSFTYDTFNQLLNVLFADGRTTGNNQSEEYLFYAKLNLQRMKRWDKTFRLREDISDIITNLIPQDWWVITEGWCGDSAQCLPAIQKMVEASNDKINLQIVLRDENPQIMDQYLTHGISRSIPILAAFDKEGNPLFKWGPRPYGAQMLLTAWKNNPARPSFEEFEKEMHTWYTQDKGNTLQNEFMNLLQN